MVPLKQNALPFHRDIHHVVSRIALLFTYLLIFSTANLWSQGIIISWDSNNESDLAGYKIYYGKTSRSYQYTININMKTSYQIETLPDTGTFYFAVTAYDHTGNESAFSEEVSLLIDKILLSKRLFFMMFNYPNPFNPETQIPYYLGKTACIKLMIYDLLGREVRLLEEGEKMAGEYEVNWDGKNESGIRVANGVYLCRLTVGNYYQTRKLVLSR